MTNYLGIDYGKKRIGLSYGNNKLSIAVPLCPSVETSNITRFSHIDKVITQRNINNIVIGYPTIVSKAIEVDSFIGILKRYFTLPVYKYYELLTSVAAKEKLQSICILHKYKKSSNLIRFFQKTRKNGIGDSIAAMLILQDYFSSISNNS